MTEGGGMGNAGRQFRCIKNLWIETWTKAEARADRHPMKK